MSRSARSRVASSAASRRCVHSTISMPSSATSKPAASTLRRSAEPSIRIGLVLLMWIKMRRPRRPAERRERAVRAVDRHVAHAPAGLVAGAGRDHFVVGEQRAVEQHDVGAVEPLAQRRRHRGGARNIEQPARRRRRSRRRHWRRSRRRARIVVLEIERHLAGHGEQLGLKAAGQRKRLAGRDGLAASPRRRRARRTSDWRRARQAFRRWQAR